MTRSVTVREPEYTARDRAVLLADLAARNEPRGRHGIRISEATDPEHQYDWEVDLPTMDFAQQKLSQAKRAYEKAYPEAETDSLLWKVRRASQEA